MIKFFRKFRQDLLTKNKFTKYLMYALGEIVLVVIGILIAILLNESRNKASNETQKEIVLKALQLEFQSNLTQLDTVLVYSDKILEAYPKVIALAKSTNGITDTKEVRDLIQDLAYNWTFNSSNGALRTAISSGEIHLIKNDRLLELLFGWEDIVSDSFEEAHQLRDHQNGSMHIYQKYIRIGDVWAASFPGLDTPNYTPDFQGLFHDVLFQDYASLRFIYVTDYETELNTIKAQNMEIIALIHNELHK